MRPEFRSGATADATPSGAPAASIVVPVFNEEAGLRTLHARIAAVVDALDRPAEIVYVDDGSTDQSLEELLGIQADDHRRTVVSLSRNAAPPAPRPAAFA